MNNVKLTSVFATAIKARLATQPQASAYLLVEGARLLNRQDERYFPFDARLGVSLVHDDPHHDAHTASPLLFDLNWVHWEEPRRIEQLEALLINGIASVLFSQLPKPVLIENLRRHLDIKLEDGMQMLMRFFDPRVLPFWFEVLPSTHRADIALSVADWAYVDHQHQLSWLALSSVNVQNNAVDFPLIITAQQEEDLMRKCLPYTLLDRLLVDPNSLLEKTAPEQRYLVLNSLIEKAQAYGFEGMGNLENFCRLGLEYGIDFDQKTSIKRALTQQNRSNHVHEILAALTDSEWMELKAS